MTLLPAIAVAATVVYSLSSFIGRYFSELATQVICLFLFVGVMVTVQMLLKKLRGD